MLGALYKTKKSLKVSVGQRLLYEVGSINYIGPPQDLVNGTFHVVGPSTQQRNWYAKVTMKNGKIAKVE